MSEVNALLVELGELTAQSSIRQSVVQRVHWQVAGERCLFDPTVSSSGYKHGTEASLSQLDALDWKLLRLLSAPKSSSLRVGASLGLATFHSGVSA